MYDLHISVTTEISLLKRRIYLDKFWLDDTLMNNYYKLKWDKKHRFLQITRVHALVIQPILDGTDEDQRRQKKRLYDKCSQQVAVQSCDEGSTMCYCQQSRLLIGLNLGMGGLSRLAFWHFPGGPVGPPSRWAATSNIEVMRLTPLTWEG